MAELDFKSGKVILNDFDFRDDLPLSEQLWSIKEDIVQVRYKNEKYILDLGWYPEFNLEEGCFKLVVVKRDDWLNSLFCKTTQSLVEIRQYIIEAVAFTEALQLKGS